MPQLQAIMYVPFLLEVDFSEIDILNNLLVIICAHHT